MRSFSFAITLLVAFTGFTLAQQTSAAGAVPTAGTAPCEAQNIVDACLTSMKPQLNACGPNDWKCLCEQSNNVLTCYNNCPKSPDRFGAEQTKQSYCNAANAYSSLSSSSSTATATAITTTTSATKTTETAAGSTTTSSAGFSPSESKGAAAVLAVEGGGLLAAALAGFIVL